MAHIVDYLKKYGNKPFKQYAFNEVDALILAQFSYLKFNELVPKLTEQKDLISIEEMNETMDENVVFSDERYRKDNKALFEGMLSGIRFKSMKCGYFADILDENVETQFSAITCFPEGTLPVVVFRGTDENIVGWKEDFNMAFRNPVAGQQLAVLYINQVGLRIKDNFIVCGHSKGGNFAVYASMNALPSIEERIETIYSFDGPGFRAELLKSDQYSKIESRVKKLIPKSSLVGMLLASHEEYRVVESSSLWLFQHNPYSWLTKQGNFKYTNDIYKGTKFRNQSLNEWILGLNDDELNTFINTLFSILEGSEAKTTIEVAMDWKKSMAGMIGVMQQLDSKSKESMHTIFQQFFDILILNLKQNISEKKEQTLKFLDKNDDM